MLWKDCKKFHFPEQIRKSKQIPIRVLTHTNWSEAVSLSAAVKSSAPAPAAASCVITKNLLIVVSLSVCRLLQISIWEDLLSIICCTSCLTNLTTESCCQQWLLSRIQNFYSQANFVTAFEVLWVSILRVSYPI